MSFIWYGAFKLRKEPQSLSTVGSEHLKVPLQIFIFHTRDQWGGSSRLIIH